MGENTSIWWSGPLGFGVKVISYNWYILQSCPLILGEGGGGQWAKCHFGEGGGGQWANLILAGGVVVVSDQNLILGGGGGGVSE